jgi:uncharacterized protein (TIGR03435 family)
MLQKQRSVPFAGKWHGPGISVRHVLCVGLSMIVASGVTSSQTATTKELRFEVSSVKPASSASGRFTMNGGPGTSDPGRISYTNIMLRRIILRAYEVKNYQISGPDWLDTLRFDITAKVPDGTTKEQFQAMLRNLLFTRFKMNIHRESKELPIYALLVARNGPKIKARAGDAASTGKLAEDQLAIIQPAEGKDGFPALSLRTPGLVIETKNGPARVTANEVPMTKLADLLSGQVGRPVIDMTGLVGYYSFVVYFTPEGPNSADGSEPSIFGALQEQLGLRLEPRRGPVELLMIDHAEKVPTEN